MSATLEAPTRTAAEERDLAVEQMRVIYEDLRLARVLDWRHHNLDGIARLSSLLADLGAHPALDHAEASADPLSAIEEHDRGDDLYREMEREERDGPNPFTGRREEW